MSDSPLVLTPPESTSINTSGPGSSVEVSSLGKSQEEGTRKALGVLREFQIEPVDFLMHILDKKFQDGSRYRTSLFGEDGRLGALLDLVKSDDEGRKPLGEWVRGAGLELIGDIVINEVESVKVSQSLPTSARQDRLQVYPVRSIPQLLSPQRVYKVPQLTRALEAMAHTAGTQLSPALSDRIPRELWGNIFLECLPSQHYIKPSPSCAPMLLCQVNKAWRSIALSLSPLWSSIAVNVYEESDTGEVAEGLGTWLGRSGVRPLSISLRVGDEYGPCLDPILNLLISFIRRWEDVQLELFGLCDSSISSIYLLRAPLLKRFEVNFNPWSHTADEPLFSMLSGSPLLTDFVLYGSEAIFYSLEIARCTLPWSQFTRFTTNFFLDPEDILEVLRLSPNLIGCTFKFMADGSPLPTDMLIVHQRLRTLNLAFHYEEDETEFFDHLTLPALCDLAFESDKMNYGWPWDSFIAFLSRSGCSLNTFKVQTRMVPIDQLIELLGLLPTLTELSIEGAKSDPLGDTLFHSLTCDKTKDGLYLCPKLQVITLEGFFAASKGKLTKMLLSRCRPDSSRSQIACLRRVTVNCHESRWDEHLKELKEVRDHGHGELEVVVAVRSFQE